MIDLLRIAAVGIEAESGSINKLLGELKGEDVLEVIARGREKLAAVPSGGGGVGKDVVDLRGATCHHCQFYSMAYVRRRTSL